MNTIDFVDKLFHIVFEITLPAVGAWGAYLAQTWLRQWLKDDTE